MAVSLPVASKPATGDDGAVSSTTYWIVLLCFVLFTVANIIVTYVCALLKPPTRGVCDCYCNCTPIVVNKICLKQITSVSIVHSAVCSVADKKNTKLRATGLREGNLPVTSELSAQRANNTENEFIWWCHHGPYALLSVFIFFNICDIGVSCCSSRYKTRFKDYILHYLLIWKIKIFDTPLQIEIVCVIYTFLGITLILLDIFMTCFIKISFIRFSIYSCHLLFFMITKLYSPGCTIHPCCLSTCSL